MSTNRMVAVALIVLGVVVLTYSGIRFRTRDAPLDPEPVHSETARSHYVPPVLGAVALIGGVVLLLASGKKDG